MPIWVNPEDTTLAEISQIQKHKRTIPLKWGPWRSQANRVRKEHWLPGAGGSRKWGGCWKGCGVSVLQDRKSSVLAGGDTWTTR